MIEQRVGGGDKDAIDRAIWDRFGGEYAIMATDLAGFSRQVARFGIIHFLQTIHEQMRMLVPLIDSHGGTLVKTEADSMLILYPTPGEALASALAMQQACRDANQHRNDEEHVLLCAGIGHGRLLKIGDDDVFGHEVNLASKLGEDIAKASEILVTCSAHAALAEYPDVTWDEVPADYAGETLCWRVRS
ncbi:MAG: adenylate/guanylate cyclase domain-containing protein [Kofleriaceae bacterium]